MKHVILLLVAATSLMAQSVGGVSVGGGGGGAPTDATYWLGSANGSLSAEIVVNDIASLEAAIAAYDFNDAANLTTGDIAAARMAANVSAALDAGLGTADCVLRNGSGAIACSAALTLSGDELAVDASGSTTTNPAGIGYSNWGSGNAARTAYGGSTGIQAAFGNAMQLYGFQSIILRGNTGNTSPPSFESLNNIGVYIVNGMRSRAKSGGVTAEFEDSSGNDLVTVGGSQTALFQDTTATTGITSVIVKAGAGQSTTDLTQWQDNAGAVLARVRSDGDLESPNVLTEDTDDRTTGFIGTDTAEAGTTTTNLTMTAHGLTTGQVVCNVTRSACVSVFAVPDADNVTLATAITGQTSGDAIRTYDYPNRRSSWYHQTTPIDDIFLDNIPLGSIEMTWDAAPTRNFDSLIYLDLPDGAAIDKGRGLFVWNHGYSDGINVLADNGGVAAAFICGDASTPTNNSFCEAHEVRSQTSIGSYVRSTATAGGPHLMFLDQQSTAAANPTAMIDITGNAAHTGFNVKNSGGNTSVIYYQALDSEGDVRFQMSGNGIELGDTGDDSASTTFDFHSGSATADYDVRLLSTGGAGTAGAGTLTFYAATVDMSGLVLKADELDLDDAGTKPTCDASQRGKIWYDEGASGVADTAEICGKDASDVYAWVAIATF